jgi:pSer/pThr/pTyr-binding forkhead associated (FHA) protein
MQCPNCQHWNEAGSRFCEECGFELPTTNGGNYQVPVRDANAPASSAAVVQPVPQAQAEAVPDIPAQNLTPVEDPTPAAYTGPHLLLQSTGSIFKLGAAAVLGREDPSLQIDLEGYPDGKFVSHRHAQIVKMDDKYYIEDLGSSNHTWVNDLKLAQGQAEPLKDGDLIKLGKIELTFHEA